MLGLKWGSVGENGDFMLLTGTFHRTLDEKCRLALPKRLREMMHSRAESEGRPEASAQADPGSTAGNSSAPGGGRLLVYLAPGTDGSLALYTAGAYGRLADRLAQSSPLGHDVRAFRRMFYAQTQSVEVDAQGRLRIPAELAELARLGKEIVLVGVGDSVELWDKGRWEHYLKEKQSQYDQIAERAFGAAPSTGGQPRASFGESGTLFAGESGSDGRDVHQGDGSPHPRLPR